MPMRLADYRLLRLRSIYDVLCCVKPPPAPKHTWTCAWQITACCACGPSMTFCVASILLLCQLYCDIPLKWRECIAFTKVKAAP